MARRLGRQVLRLIRERSYLSGALPDLERAVAERTADLAAAQMRLQDAKTRLAEMDARIVALEPDLQPQDIRPTRKRPARQGFHHGNLTDSLVGILREAGSAGITTTALMERLLALFPMDLSTHELREVARHRFRRRLLDLKSKGVVLQVDEEVAASGRKVARWLWTGE